MAKFLLILIVIAGIVWWLRRKPGGAMTEAEARAILGVGADASVNDIRAAHRRLIQAVHPDRGGSAELAKRLNGARDLLLRRLR